MSKLNPKNKSATATRAGVSYNGNPQTLKTAKQQLFEIVVMTLYGKDSYYESTDQRLARLEEALGAVVTGNGFDFVANTIVYARSVMNIRSLPIVLTVLFAKALREQNKTYSNLRQVVCDVIQRADELASMYAVALQIFGNKKTVPMAIKRGVADAFNKFNEYQFGKYNSSSVVKLRDVLRIVHPKTKDELQGALYEKIMKDALAVPYTWETTLSANGQLPAEERKSDAQIWTELVESEKVGYMAMLRNLRNIEQAKVSPETMKTVCDFISNKDNVLKSKQLPFRYVNALNNVGNNKLNRSISRALDHSLSNVPQIGENVWIIVDCSGSMEGWYSRNNNVSNTPIKTAAIFAVALAKANVDAANVKITLFSDHARNVTINPDDSVMSSVEKVMGLVEGGGTNLQAALDLKPKLGFEPDTVVLLSDMQVNQLRARNSVNIFEPNTVKVAINLEGYDSTPVSEIQGWYQLSGWSERLFDFIPAMRNKTSVAKVLSVPYLGQKVKTFLD